MKKRAHRWINGTRGAISLMLAALMLPFYSLAAILIETQRYQSSVRALDELLGTSSISVLANYDTYLHDRFGLLAVAQSPEENALSASLLSYLNKNQLTDIAGLVIAVALLLVNVKKWEKGPKFIMDKHKAKQEQK